MAKYLLGQCFMWTILGNTISLVDFRRFRASTLNRTLWLYLWYNPKNDILEFGAYWWSICSGSVLCGQLLGNTITLTYFSNSWCKHFEQDATNLSLEHFKEQHTGIWCLLVKYLLWQCAMWTTFGKHNYFDRFSNSWCKHFEQDAMNISLEHFKEQHTGIWCLLVKYLLW